MHTRGVIREISALLICTLLFAGCGIPRSATGISGERRIWKQILKDTTFAHQHTGFALYDPAEEKMVCEYQSAKYFTPASNTKILTLLTCLHVLPDSVETLRYAIRNDSLLFHGMADPSFARVGIPTSSAPITLLQAFPGRLVYHRMPQVQPYGPGWAWDDFSYAFQAERSVLPIYGNCIEACPKGDLEITPRYFSEAFHPDTALHRPLSRHPQGNSFFYHPARMKTGVVYRIPFRVTEATTLSLLRDLLNKSVETSTGDLPTEMHSVYGASRDTLLRIMMQESDNAIAEQLLMQCAFLMRGTFTPDTAIVLSEHALLAGIPDPVRWVDGSGLSRYNMITPRSLVFVLRQISMMEEMEYLTAIFPAGGVSGTIRDSFRGDPPYVFAKSGSLRNQYCLSGFLKTRKGKWLIFSFLNGNFHGPVHRVQAGMEKILYDIHVHY